MSLLNDINDDADKIREDTKKVTDKKQGSAEE
jgi:hypothetical protein